MRRAGRWASVGLAALAAAAPARGAPVVGATAEIEAAGGHDDNMFLSAAPDGLGTLLRLGGAYVSLAPALAADLATGGFRLRLAYLGDFRAADSVGRLDTHLLDFRVWLPGWGAWRMHVALFGGQFGASQFPADQYWFGGGDLGLRLAMRDTLTLVLGARAELRALAADATGSQQKDWLLAPALRLPWQAAPSVEITPFVTAVLVTPLTDASPGRFRRLRAGLDTTATASSVTLGVGGWAGPLTIGEVGETQVGGRIEARIDVSHSLELFALADLAIPTSEGASDLRAHRLFSIGVVGRLVTRVGRPRAEVSDLRPRFEPGQVRFRLTAPRATSVVVVGSWNDWAGPGDRLVASGEPDIWETTRALRPGVYRYHFVVDGQARRPPDAPRYMPDGFGSEDGVIDVADAGQTQ